MKSLEHSEAPRAPGTHWSYRSGSSKQLEREVASHCDPGLGASARGPSSDQEHQSERLHWRREEKKKREKKKAANAYAEGLELKENKRKPSSAPELGTVPVSKAHRMHISIDQSGPAAASVPPLTVAVPSWIQDPSCAPARLQSPSS